MVRVAQATEAEKLLYIQVDFVILHFRNHLPTNFRDPKRLKGSNVVVRYESLCVL